MFLISRIIKYCLLSVSYTHLGDISQNLTVIQEMSTALQKISQALEAYLEKTTQAIGGLQQLQSASLQIQSAKLEVQKQENKLTLQELKTTKKLEESKAKLDDASRKISDAKKEINKDVYNRQVYRITREHCYQVYTQKQSFSADYVVFAMGSEAGKLSGVNQSRYDLLKKLGLDVIPSYPSLVQMKTQPVLKQLKGVRVKGTFSL